MDITNSWIQDYQILGLTIVFVNWITGYSFDQGCEEGIACSSGKYCGDTFECTGCTFQECLHKATERNPFAFAYRGTNARYCRFCNSDDYQNIRDYADWGIYKDYSTEYVGRWIRISDNGTIACSRNSYAKLSCLWPDGSTQLYTAKNGTIEWDQDKRIKGYSDGTDRIQWNIGHITMETWEKSGRISYW